MVVAPPGSKTYGALSVNVQGFAHAELVGRVPPGAFRPSPSVDSAILRVTPREDPVVSAAVEPRFAALELQIESLNGRMDERPADIGVGQLEAQVRLTIYLRPVEGKGI